jgi:hypothetical protein
VISFRIGVISFTFFGLTAKAAVINATGRGGRIGVGRRGYAEVRNRQSQNRD